MSVVQNLTKRFKSWTNYCEKASNAHLDEFTTNAGYGNYTCFGRDYAKIIGESESIWNGVAWCDEYVDVNFVAEFGIDVAKKLLGGFSAYTPTSANNFKSMGRWHTSNPQEGDVIFFKDSYGTICHTGYVTGVDSSKVYTNEGNTSSIAGVVANGGCVANKSYTLGYSRIAGYGRPDYSIVEEDITMSQYEELLNSINTMKESYDNIINQMGAEIKTLRDEKAALVVQIGKIMAVLESTMVYNYIDDNMPDWAKEQVQAAVNSGAVQGDETGRLNLSYKDLRQIVREYRAGLYR